MNRALPIVTALLLLPTSLFAQAQAASVAEARAAALIGEYRDAASLYKRAATASTGVDASDYYLQAADALLKAQLPAEAEALLAGLPPTALNPAHAQLAAIYRARARLAQNDAAAALRALPNSPDSPHAAMALAVRADALFLMGDSNGGTTARVLRDQLLSEPEQVANRAALWQSLHRSKLAERLPNSLEPVVRGWVELAALDHNNADIEQLQTWRARNTRHPVSLRLERGLPSSQTGPGSIFNVVLAALQPAPATAAEKPSMRQVAADAPGGFALLLPLTGSLAEASQAVRAGAIAAMNENGATAPLLQIHDSAGGIRNILASALANNAEAIIGPLRKEDVTELSDLAPALPVVSLNYPSYVTPINFLPFGLAPEDEARSAARDALAANYRGALILSLEGDWGSRAAAAFTETFTAGGGAVIRQGSLRASERNFTTDLKRLLGLSDASSRASELAAMGIPAQLEAQPRNDIDVVFLALRGRHARMVVPQLRVLGAGHLPLYAVAAASDAGSGDLGDVRVCDIPWRQDVRELSSLHERLAAVNPSAPDTQRLFALGFDAYQLALLQRSGGNLRSASQLPAGLAGRLVLERGEARRQLYCQPIERINPELGEARPAPLKAVLPPQAEVPPVAAPTAAIKPALPKPAAPRPATPVIAPSVPAQAAAPRK